MNNVGKTTYPLGQPISGSTFILNVQNGALPTKYLSPSPLMLLFTKKKDKSKILEKHY